VTWSRALNWHSREMYYEQETNLCCLKPLFSCLLLWNNQINLSLLIKGVYVYCTPILYLESFLLERNIRGKVVWV
jgi:hypothetical protein